MIFLQTFKELQELAKEALGDFSFVYSNGDRMLCNKNERYCTMY